MYYIGIDGGGTKTFGVLSDCRGEQVRTIKKGAGNIAVLDEKSISKLLNEIVFELLSGVGIDQVKWATFGFAGAGRQKEDNLAKQIISGMGFKNFTLMTDAELLYYSIHGESRGVLIASGTGSVCIVKNKNGEMEQLGGWGYLLGDEGSGYDIGRRAIRHAINEKELGEPSSSLTKKLLAFYNVENVKALISAIYAADNPQNLIAAFARNICEQALAGEPNAGKIIDAAARSLVELAERSLIRLQSKPPYKIALSGGVLNEPSVVTNKFKQLAEYLKIDFCYKKQKLPPAAAGILNAIKNTGENIHEKLIKKLQDMPD